MPAAADVPPPTGWPQTQALQPAIDTTAYSIRFAGRDRYQTNVTTNLALRGGGGYPFSTPDPSSGWWGVGACPRSIIVVAGDVFADALGAASLSDPTDKSTQPRLTVAASNDPTFIPVGTIDRPDTAYAPIVITQSARQSATSLSPTARSTAIDLNHGGCTSAKQAIIVGGSASVPTGVAQELITLGYDEVFRVGGADRYDTAAKIALALGTGNGTTATSCLDLDTTDGSARMGWYGNDVAEFRPDAKTCELLPRAVVLADGGQGADALAAGWWTSFWQVPILLTAPDGSLPAATQNALKTMGIDAIIVLGGEARIPESTVDDAKRLASGPAAGRVRGSDRYATSVLMAEYFGGWWPTGNAADFAGSMVCLAASGDAGGWPDALAAGPWCAAAGGAARGPRPPARLLAPTEGRAPLIAGPNVTPAHDAVPMLLTPPGASTLADVVRGLLASAFDPTSSWCSSASSGDCVFPGFAVAFGGASALPASAVDQLDDLVSGGTDGSPTDRAPILSTPFVTNIDLSPVFSSSSAGANELCVLRGGVSGVRWLSVNDFAPVDVALGGIYRTDADGIARSPGVSRPFCAPLNRADEFVKGTSLSGHATDSSFFDLNKRLTQSAAFDLGEPATSGVPLFSDPPDGGSTTLTFVRGAATTIRETSNGDSATITDVSLTLHLTRGTDSGTPSPDVLTGAITITTDKGSIAGSLAGEGLFENGMWKLRGRMSWSGGTWNVHNGSGGFEIDLSRTSMTFLGDGVVT